MLREAVTAHEAPARDKGVTLVYEPGSDVMAAHADRARLMQLFQNLLGNAVKFCKSGDRITVSSRTRGEQAHIEISDTGPGIAAEDLPLIFDPYYSASGKHQKTGTGLGLYIGKGIVDAHGGTDTLRVAARRGNHLQHHLAADCGAGAGSGCQLTRGRPGRRARTPLGDTGTRNRRTRLVRPEPPAPTQVSGRTPSGGSPDAVDQ